MTKAIEELEKEGRVLVVRTEGKGAAQGEGTMKMVFLDDIGPEKDPLDQGALFSLSRIYFVSPLRCLLTN